MFSVHWDAGTITTEWGVLDGDMQEQREYVSHGKAGRTLREQINSRVNSIINKKLDKGYVYDIEEASKSKHATNALGFVKPMLAQPFDKVRDIRWDGISIQRKYNGHRCLITNHGSDIIAYSRNGKIITSIDHILRTIDIPENMTVDGELYIHGLSLQKISSLVKRRQPESADLVYVAYDVVLPAVYPDRLRVLERALKGSQATIAETTHHHRKKPNVPLALSEAVSQGYEGLVLRPLGFGYETGKRSKGLIKVKQVMDDEFLVIAVERSAEGYAVLVCVTEEGKQFKATAPGNHSEKREVLENASHYVGMFVRISFAEWTEDKVPFHPVAEMFRNKSGE